MLMAGHDYGCTREAALIAALTQDRDLLIRRPPRPVQDTRDNLLGDRADSDFFILMRAWRYAQQHGFQLDACRRLGIHAATARQVTALLQQFLRVAEEQGLDINEQSVDQETVRKCILLAFSDQLARRRDEGTLRCDLVHGRRGELTRDSAVRHSRLFVASEIDEIEHAHGDLTVLLRLATAVEEAWLEALFPEEMSERTDVTFDATGKRVVSQQLRLFRDLVLSIKRGGSPPEEAAAALLAREVLTGRFTLKHWTPAVEQWIYRLNGLAQWCPELGLPPIHDADRAFLVQQICLGSYSARELAEAPVWPGCCRPGYRRARRSLSSSMLQHDATCQGGARPVSGMPRTDRPCSLPPSRISTASNRPRRLPWADKPLVVEILAPNQRPVQVTQDLAGFWQTTYPEVKKTLQKRYPKHAWR